MRLLLAVLVVLCMTVGTARANDDGNGLTVVGNAWSPDTLLTDVVIDLGPPKGVVGADGVRCVGTVTQGGVTLKQVEYSGVDADEYGKDAEREKQWSRDNCKWQLEQGMAGYFKWTLGQELDVSQIRVTYTDV